MFRHVLFWNVEDRVDGKSKSESIDILTDLVLAIKDKIAVIRAIEVGRNRASVANACDMVVMIEFDSWEDLQVFLEHPEHKKLGASVEKYRRDSYVVDYER